MSEALDLLLVPFAAAVAFVLIHAYFGVHVLQRRIVFADLALAQLSALGATVAFANGHAVGSAAGFAYALVFTVAGAALLTLVRPLARAVSQEALVGLLYVVATAGTVLVVDRSPQGAEHVKAMLVGSILMVDTGTLAKLAAIYAAIGALLWLARKPMLAASHAATGSAPVPRHVWLWDFAFYVAFGVVVTSSVQTAGVLLVFSFLIVPALIGALFATRLAGVLAIAWLAGTSASAVGLAASYVLDLPTGAAMVAVLGLALVLAGIRRWMLIGEPVALAARRRRAGTLVACAFLFALAAGAAWLVVNPRGDQPLLALVEQATGMRPTSFLSEADARIYEEAARDVVRFQTEVDRLDAMEREARYRGRILSDDEIRRIASYQQSFNEMVRGERFVQTVLRGKARERARWIVGMPLLLAAAAALGWLARRRSRPPRAAPADQAPGPPLDTRPLAH